MTDLLDFALEAHGGTTGNASPESAFDLTLGGYLFEIKQHPDGLRTALVKVDARRPRTLIVPFPEQGKRRIYQEGKVWVQTDAGALPSKKLSRMRNAAERSFWMSPDRRRRGRDRVLRPQLTTTAAP
jgi:hypothetical protein